MMYACVRDILLLSLSDINECEDIKNIFLRTLILCQQITIVLFKCPSGKTSASNNKTCGGEIVYF